MKTLKMDITQTVDLLKLVDTLTDTELLKVAKHITEQIDLLELQKLYSVIGHEITCRQRAEKERKENRKRDPRERLMEALQ